MTLNLTKALESQFIIQSTPKTLKYISNIPFLSNIQILQKLDIHSDQRFPLIFMARLWPA